MDGLMECAPTRKILVPDTMSKAEECFLSQSLVVLFGSVVSIPAGKCSWIARNGEHSMFSTYMQIFPEVNVPHLLSFSRLTMD